METIITTYSILSMAIVMVVTTLLSIIPFKVVQKLSQPISFALIAFAPIVVLVATGWLIYKLIKCLFNKRASIRNMFLTRDQKVQMLEKLYNNQTAEYIH